tara:strand:+ start:402 stop:572 length:171 start_codon:yes stop_codon:yes gene_type:complete
MAETYSEDGSVKKTKGSKKPFIEKIFKLPYKTLEVYKTIKDKRAKEKKIINKINNN